MKKLIALLLALVMVVGLVACAKEPAATQPSTNNPPATQGTQGNNDPQPSESTPAVEYPPEVSKPVEIEWWMTFGSGANADNLALIVEEFNKNNEWGITVTASHQGNYADVLAKLLTDIAGGTNPVLATISESGAGTLGLQNLTQDLTPYLERDGINYRDTFHSALTEQLLIHDTDGDGIEEIIAAPYCRSVSLAYHNASVWAEIGVAKENIPTTIEELVPLWEKIYSETGKFGLALLSDPSYYQCGLLQSLSVKLTGKTNGGVIGADGISAPSLTDGTMLKLMNDWTSWCDAGWCWRFTTSDAGTNAKNLVVAGDCATVFQSSGSMTGYIKSFETDEQGKGMDIDDLWATIQPGYGGFGGRAGGGNLAIIPANHTEEEIDAAWKFMQYAAFDAEVTARSALNTGYVCTTKAGLETKTWTDAANAQPLLWVANKGVNNAYDATLGYYRTNWNNQLKAMFSTLITDEANTQTPEELINQLAAEAHLYLDPAYVA